MKSTPILSISIPTYNRPQQIQKQIRRLLPQLTEDTLLTIYDNCSPQPVEELFTEDELNKFTIIRHSQNIGGDANIIRCFELCHTPWLWTISDDDYVQEGAVDIALHLIRSYYDCAFINIWSWDEGRTNDFASFAKKLSDKRMFSAAFAMSTCLYNMNLLKEDLTIYYRYASSMLGQLIMVAKNIQRTDAPCFFTFDCHLELGADVGWNYGDYIHFSSLITYAFKKSQKSVDLNKTLLRGYHSLNYRLITLNRQSSNIGYWERWRLLLFAGGLQGIYRALWLCPNEFAKALVATICGERLSILLRKLLYTKH